MEMTSDQRSAANNWIGIFCDLERNPELLMCYGSEEDLDPY